MNETKSSFSWKDKTDTPLARLTKREDSIRNESRWYHRNIEDHRSSTLATSCEESTHWKRLWCWEGLGAGREGDDRGWDGWMASLTRWTWVWVNSGSWWRTGRPGVLQFIGSQRVRYDWATDLIWSDLSSNCYEPGIVSLNNFQVPPPSLSYSFCLYTAQHLL